MSRPKKREIVLKKLVFHCPKLRRQVSVKREDIFFSATCNPCELCGDHGKVSAEFTCKCGSGHTVEIKDW